jgi:aromatic-L-amino-acid decarboxylase
MVCLTIARNALAGVDVRADGVTSLPQPLRFYSPDQAHSCHQKALETLGLGAQSLRYIPSDDNFRLDLEALERQITEDHAAGMRPVCVIATAGTTNTGAIDDIPAIRAICERETMWFHIDGCIGALLKIAPQSRHLVEGLEAADSIALDPHKWLHTPFEAGCVLVRDASKHRAAFEMHGEYLQIHERGLLAGTFLAD